MPLWLSRASLTASLTSFAISASFLACSAASFAFCRFSSACFTASSFAFCFCSSGVRGFGLLLPPLPPGFGVGAGGVGGVGVLPPSSYISVVAVVLSKAFCSASASTDGNMDFVIWAS